MNNIRLTSGLFPTIVHSFSTRFNHAISGDLSFRRLARQRITRSTRALPVLFGLIAISILATAVIACSPPLLLRQRLPQQKDTFRALLFFLFIGIGYILVQVSLIQKFVLFLGHPTYALTVVIFSMLLSSGIGSIWSKRLMQSLPSRLTLTLVLIAAGISALSVCVTPIAEGGVTLPFFSKVLITVVLIAPVGFLMGMPFPTGLTFLERATPSAVRWAWAVNAAASVLGSAGAMILAIYWGLSLTLLAGGLLYLGALASFLLSPLSGKSDAHAAVGLADTA